jgi:hypothetical protein
MSQTPTPIKTSPHSLFGVSEIGKEKEPKVVELGEKEREGTKLFVGGLTLCVEYEGKWRDIMIKLNMKKTDGKEKAKPFETIVQICRSLKEDLRYIITKDNTDELLTIEYTTKT